MERPISREAGTSDSRWQMLQVMVVGTGRQRPGMTGRLDESFPIPLT